MRSFFLLVFISPVFVFSGHGLCYTMCEVFLEGENMKHILIISLVLIQVPAFGECLLKRRDTGEVSSISSSTIKEVVAIRQFDRCSRFDQVFRTEKCSIFEGVKIITTTEEEPTYMPGYTVASFIQELSKCEKQP